MHFYQFHIGDFTAATVHLSEMEELCYRRLIDMYYDTEAPIPLETDRVSRRLRLGSELVISVLSEFFICTENGWKNARCDAEISAYHHKVVVAQTNGKLGGRPKKTDRVFLANPDITQTKANHKPITNNHKQLKEEKKGANFVAPVVPEDVSQDVWSDFLQARKAAKAQVTDRVIDSIRTEARNVGWSLEQAMREMVARGWRGFKGEWVAGKARGQSDSKTAAAETIFGKNMIGERHVIDITPVARLLGI